MRAFRLSTLASACLVTPLVFADNAAPDMEVIEVKGELLKTSITNATNAVDIIDQKLIEESGAAHIQDILQQTANVNFASGSSRARFFQIRGVGERSQFVDPVNPSVGVAIDGIDYSDMAGAATLFDIAQVEIFKGPQGTNVGANAMAGFINLTSTAPGSEQISKATVELGNYGLQQFAFAYGNDINEQTAYRVSVNKLDGDGYIDNRHLDRSDTNGFDELSIRANVEHEFNRDLTTTLTLHKFDFDNGYDTFSLDLDRTTLSDNPGFDRQDTTSIAANTLYTGFNDANVRVFLSNSNSDLEYGYDEDWAFAGIHEDEYSSTDHYLRDRKANQLDVSVTSADQDWVMGVYFQTKETDLTRQYTYLSADFMSQYEVNNMAFYAEERHQVSESISISAGIRVEKYDADYQDSNAIVESTSETMAGGHLTISKQLEDNWLTYLRLSRGFKAGGVNGEALARKDEAGLERFRDELLLNANFESEILNNIEFGTRYNTEALQVTANVFYAYRDQMQVKQFITNSLEVANSDEPPVFVGFLSNAPSGKNYGLETTFTYQWQDDVVFSGAFALLETEVDDMSRKETDPVTWEDKYVSIDGRAQAHAPGYQYNLGFDWQVTDRVSFNAEVVAKDSYFYSFSHDEKSDVSTLLNAGLVYRGDMVDVTFWMRNITDEDYGVRGFYFGNDPRDGYSAKNYEQFGEPRVFGVRLDYIF